MINKKRLKLPLKNYTGECLGVAILEKKFDENPLPDHNPFKTGRVEIPCYISSPSERGWFQESSIEFLLPSYPLPPASSYSYLPPPSSPSLSF